MKEDLKIRVMAVCLFVLSLFAMVACRLFCLQYLWHDSLRAYAEEQHRTRVKIPAERGIIYDRNLQPLATNVKRQSLYANPKQISHPELAATELSNLLQLPFSDVHERLTWDRTHVYIKRWLDDKTARAVRLLDIPGLGLETESCRFYPKGRLACHVLGFAGMDGGLEGVEYQFDEFLRGVPGWHITVRDVRNRPLPPLTREYRAPSGGYSIVLTIDEVIQYIVEKELAAVFAEYQPARAMAVVMDPTTGEILALAVKPDFDPSQYRNYNPRQWRNRAITDIFEPGSVFKMVTAAAALEEDSVSPETLIYCEGGYLYFHGHMINDTHPFETLTFRQVIEESSNIGITKVAALVDKANVYRFARGFGFGELTGVDFPGESRGILRPISEWSRLSMATVPMGQEVGVTALQLARAFSTIANGGGLMRPMLVSSIRDSNGHVVKEFRPEKVRQVISRDTAAVLLDILRGVVERGTGQLAAVPGYDVAGKTGTAQKIDPLTGRYDRENFVAVFAGILPAHAPRLTILVVVDSPVDKHWGGTVAAPVFRNIAAACMRHLEISPTQRPEPPDRILGQGVALGDRGEQAVQSAVLPLRMPDVTGKTMRMVLDVLGPYALECEFRGSGMAVEQWPDPGTIISPGRACRVLFDMRAT